MLVMQVCKIMTLFSEKSMLFQRELTYKKTKKISTYIYNLGIGKGEFDYSAAIGLFNSAINVLLVLIANWISKKMTDTSLW
jgi:putative aldouronate transport system permease protein